MSKKRDAETAAMLGEATDPKSTKTKTRAAVAAVNHVVASDEFAIDMHKEGGGAWRLMHRVAADADIEPLWGQPGHFGVAVTDNNHRILVDIKTNGLFTLGSEFAFVAEAVEPGVFLVASGRRSFLDLPLPGAPKAGVSGWVVAEINRWRMTDDTGKKRKTPRPFVELLFDPTGAQAELIPTGETAPADEPAEAE